MLLASLASRANCDLFASGGLNLSAFDWLRPNTLMNLSPGPIAKTMFDVERTRADFAYLQVEHPSGLPIAYLDSGASTQHPAQVLEAMQDCYENAYSNVHRGIHFLSEAATDRYETSRATIARFINSSSDQQVILTPGCTAGINAVAQGWGRKFVKANDFICVTQMEHHANIVPWFQLRQATGCQVKFAPITVDGQIDMPALEALLSQKPKLLAITAVSNVLGTINPIQAIITAAHSFGVRVLVDAAQAAPHMPIDVQQWDCDFLVFSGHKMLGPSGIGVLYGKLEMLEAMDPFVGGGGMIDIVSEQGFTAGELPAKLEAGTPPIVEAVGLAAAVKYLQTVGLETISQHEHSLTQAAYDKLSAIDGVHILGPSIERRSGIISFTVDRIHAHDVAQVLDQHGVAVRPGHHCTMPLHDHLGISASSRASFYLYNTLEEVDRLEAAVLAAKSRLTSRARRRV